MANRFGEEYRPQHNGSDPLRFGPPRMKRPIPGDVNPQIRPANERQWSDSGDREWLNTPNPTQSEGGIRRLQTQSYQEDDERGSYIQNGANKKYTFINNPKFDEGKGGFYSKETLKPDDKDDKGKDSGGGSKVPRKPKPNTPSGGLKKPIPTKASK